MTPRTGSSSVGSGCLSTGRTSRPLLPTSSPAQAVPAYRSSRSGDLGLNVSVVDKSAAGFICICIGCGDADTLLDASDEFTELVEDAYEVVGEACGLTPEMVEYLIAEVREEHCDPDEADQPIHAVDRGVEFLTQAGPEELVTPPPLLWWCRRRKLAIPTSTRRPPPKLRRARWPGPSRHRRACQPPTPPSTTRTPAG